MRGEWIAVGVLVVAAWGARAAQTWGDLSAPRTYRALDGERIVVVPREGKPLPIVHDGSPRMRWAATFLARVLTEMTGRRPPIYRAFKGQRGNWPKGALFIGVAGDGGTSPLPNAADEEAFRVVAKEGCVHFLGRADYAVFDWCERFLDVRDYCADGLCVEKREEVAVPGVEYSDAPCYALRQIGCGEPGEALRVAKCGGVHRGGVAVHQPARWFADERLRRDHPAIFETGETPMLCYGKGETLAYYKERIDRHIAGVEDSGGIVNTNRRIVTVCPWDAPIRCTCAACRPLFAEGRGAAGSASPIVWGRFLRLLAPWLKERHPDYMISFLPYLNFCEPPGQWVGRRGFPRRRVARIEGLAACGNAEAEVCVMPGIALLKERACRVREEAMLRDWRRITGRPVLTWQYSCWPAAWTSAPYLYGRTIRAHYARMEGTVCGSFVCGDPNDVRQALAHYVWARAMWNPAFDVEKLYDGFARRMFGAGTEPMRELIALQERGWERGWEGLACTFANVFETSFPRAEAERMRFLLVEARTRAQAAGEAVAVRRVDRYAEGFADFLLESDALAARGEAERQRRIPLGETNAMVVARSVRYPRPHYPTRLVTSREGDDLVLTIRCEEPAARTLDFAKDEPDDFIWGNDRIEIVREGAAPVRIRPTGRTEGEARATVSHDDAGWTLRVALALTDAERRAGRLRGNVCRWRVGDRKRPECERLPKSRFEHSRLNTCYTQPNDDPAAFVEFLLQ